jgi:hypothetical protein
MKNILEYVEEYKNILETLQCPEVLHALQRPDVQKVLDDPGARFQFFITYEQLIERRNKSKDSQEKLECEKQMQAALKHLTEPNDQDRAINDILSEMLKTGGIDVSSAPAHTPRYNCDEVMDDISFWEELLDVIEEIEGMSKREREKCLFRVIERDMSEGPHWQRLILKILLTDPKRRRKVREAIKSGRVYDDEKNGGDKDEDSTIL